MQYIPRIKEIREAKGLKQNWVAKQIGTTSSVLSRWEKGGVYPSLPYLYRLCQVLGVNLQELYKEK